MNKNNNTTVWVILGIVGVVALFMFMNNKNNKPEMADPSAAYCQNSGFQYKIITENDGGQYGVCIFPDKTECRSWYYYCKCAFDKRYCSEYPEKYLECNQVCK